MNCDALEIALNALSLDDSDAATVEALRSIAYQLDNTEGSASLFKTYLEGLDRLVSRTAGTGSNLAELLRGLSDETVV